MSRVHDIVDPVIMGSEDSMYALLGELRENNPVAYFDHPDYEPFWVMTRYDDIKFISQNNDKFINNPRTVIMPKEFEQALLEQFGTRNGLETLIHMDNPKHRKLRNVTREWFKPGPVSKLTPIVEDIAREFVDKMEAMGGECDFVKDIALLYPLRVIMSILGVVPEEEPMMLKLTQELFGGQDPDQGRGRTKAPAWLCCWTFSPISRMWWRIAGKILRTTWPACSPTPKWTASTCRSST